MDKRKLVEAIGRAISEHRQEPPYGELSGDDMQLARDIVTYIGKEEKIKKALGQYHRETDDVCGFKIAPGLDYDALAKQAIVIECEVEHESSPVEKLTKVMFYDDAGSILTALVRGHQGTPGKALAIIILGEL